MTITNDSKKKYVKICHFMMKKYKKYIGTIKFSITLQKFQLGNFHIFKIFRIK